MTVSFPLGVMFFVRRFRCVVAERQTLEVILLFPRVKLGRLN